MMGTILAAGAVGRKVAGLLLEGSPENFTPAINTTGTSLDAARPVFNQLVEFERGSTNVIPGLAETLGVLSPMARSSRSICARGGEIHSGVNGFTPSRVFNAEDVLFSFERQWKPDHPYAKVSGGAYDYFNDMGMPDSLKALEKVDDYTVKMTLKEPNAPIIANLAMDFATIESAEYAKMMMDKGTPDSSTRFGRTGPFQFVDYQKDAVIRFKAFDQYWGASPRSTISSSRSLPIDGALRQAQGR